MNKKDKKIFIIVTVILALILLVVSQGKFRNLSIATDSAPTTSKIKIGTLSITEGCGECGGTCFNDGSGGYVCCEIPGWTFDPVNQECNPPSPGDCSNDPSQMPDCSRYCPTPGAIIDYSAVVCCPSFAPFYRPDGNCQGFPTQISDNYYTRRSTCAPTCDDNAWGPNCLPSECRGENRYTCVKNPAYIYNWVNQGQVTGQCGIQCVSLSDCPGNLPNCESTQKCDFSCGGNTCIAVNPSTYYRLLNNQCNSISLKPSEVTTNDYTSLEICRTHIIETPTTYFRFENNKCSEVTLLPSQKTNNDYSTMEECKSKIVNPPKFNWELVIGIIVILGILGFVIYRFKGKRRK